MASVAPTKSKPQSIIPWSLVRRIHVRLDSRARALALLKTRILDTPIVRASRQQCILADLLDQQERS